MNSKLELLDFDTNLFGYGVARCSLPVKDERVLLSFKNLCKTLAIRLVYYVTSPNSESSIFLESSGFKCVDEKTYYQKYLTNNCNQDEFDNIELYLGKTLNNELLELFLASGEFSRFRLDSNFQGNEYYKLYKIWGEKSLTGEIATDIIVYKDKELKRVLGLLTFNIQNDHCTVGLIAVNRLYRNRRIGRKLMLFMENHLSKLGINKIIVPTQGHNEKACRFYEGLGYFKEKVEKIYHIWN